MAQTTSGPYRKISKSTVAFFMHYVRDLTLNVRHRSQLLANILLSESFMKLSLIFLFGSISKFIGLIEMILLTLFNMNVWQNDGVVASSFKPSSNATCRLPHYAQRQASS
ncbi:MAG: hypothetical protein B2I17_03825 [Thermoplasmatales archaeon B_DKE]|nr:MAG: hypothetical protein B2I17_03825 [Thermoplasmatales archaeon B_DKE]